MKKNHLQPLRMLVYPSNTLPITDNDIVIQRRPLQLAYIHIDIRRFTYLFDLKAHVGVALKVGIPVDLIHLLNLSHLRQIKCKLKIT